MIWIKDIRTWLFGVEIRNWRILQDVRACTSGDCRPATRWTRRLDPNRYRARRAFPKLSEHAPVLDLFG